MLEWLIGAVRGPRVRGVSIEPVSEDGVDRAALWRTDRHDPCIASKCRSYDVRARSDRGPLWSFFARAALRRRSWPRKEHAIVSWLLVQASAGSLPPNRWRACPTRSRSP